MYISTGTSYKFMSMFNLKHNINETTIFFQIMHTLYNRPHKMNHSLPNNNPIEYMKMKHKQKKIKL